MKMQIIQPRVFHPLLITPCRRHIRTLSALMVCLGISSTAHADLNQTMQSMWQARQQLGGTFWSAPNGSAYWIGRLTSELENTAPDHAGYAGARYQLGQMYVHAGDLQNAAVEFEQALHAPNATPGNRLQAHRQLIAAASQAGYPVEQTLGFIDDFEALIHLYDEAGILNGLFDTYQVQPGGVTGLDQLRAVVLEVHARRIHDYPADYNLSPQQADSLSARYMDNALEHYQRFLELAPSDPYITTMRYEGVMALAARAWESTAAAYENLGNPERALERRSHTQQMLESFLHQYPESAQAPELQGLLLRMVRHTADSPEAILAYAADLLASGEPNYAVLSLISRIGGELAGEIDTMRESTLFEDMTIEYIKKWQPEHYLESPSYQISLLQSAYNALTLEDYADAARRLKLLAEAEPRSEWLSEKLADAQDRLDRHLAGEILDDINAEIAQAPQPISRREIPSTRPPSDPWEFVPRPQPSPGFHASSPAFSDDLDDAPAADVVAAKTDNHYLLWATGALLLIVMMALLRARR